MGYTFEEAGISEDVIKLSDFISNYIHKKGKTPKTYTITKKEIPDDINLPINTLIITYDDNKEKRARGWVDLTRSKRFKSGNVEIRMTVRTLKKSVLYHEVNHILQFINLGRSGMIKKGKLSFAKSHSDKFNDEKIKTFLYLLYRSDNNEISSNVIQFYGQLKGLMKKNIKELKTRRKGLTDEIIQVWKDRYFDNTLPDREIYKMSKVLEKINLTKFFDGVDKNELNKLFSLVSSIDNGTLKHKRRNLYQFYKNMPLELKINKLTDKQLNDEMNKYQTMMNERGKKMTSRIEKVKYLL